MAKDAHDPPDSRVFPVIVVDRDNFGSSAGDVNCEAWWASAVPDVIVDVAEAVEVTGVDSTAIYYLATPVLSKVSIVDSAFHCSVVVGTLSTVIYINPDAVVDGANDISVVAPGSEDAMAVVDGTICTGISLVLTMVDDPVESAV